MLKGHYGLLHIVCDMIHIFGGAHSKKKLTRVNLWLKQTLKSTLRGEP
jgi:hypothetical protein